MREGSPFTAPAGLEAELADVVGAAAAALLCRDLAGWTFYVPRPEAIGPDHRLARIIGLAAARSLAQVYGTTNIEFPVSAAKRRRVLDLKAAGLDNREIARALWCTDRFVRKVLADEAGDTRQLQLFDRTG